MQKKPSLIPTDASEFSMSLPKLTSVDLPLKIEQKPNSAIDLSSSAFRPQFEVSDALIRLAKTKMNETGSMAALTGQKYKRHRENGPCWILEEAYLVEAEGVEFEREPTLIVVDEWSQTKPFLDSYSKTAGDWRKWEDQTEINAEELAFLSQFRVFLKIDAESLQSKIFVPNIDFALVEVSRSFRFPTTALAKSLFGKTQPPLSKGMGPLTADEAGRIHPLLFSELTSSVPVLGVWLALPSSPEALFTSQQIQRKIWSVCTAFMRCEGGGKVSISPKSFEFLVFLFGNGEVRCFKAALKGGASGKAKGAVQGFECKIQSRLLLDFSADHGSLEKGTQTEAGEDLLESIRESQRRSEEFYRASLAKMQEQIGLLTKAVASIQNSFQALETGDSSRSLGGGEHPPPLIPATHSLSFSASSKKQETQKTKRFRAENCERTNEKSIHVLEAVSVREKPDSPPPESDHNFSLTEKKEDNLIMKKIEKVSEAKEFGHGTNSRSIQVPKINNRFKIALQKNSDSSDLDCEDK